MKINKFLKLDSLYKSLNYQTGRVLYAGLIKSGRILNNAKVRKVELADFWGHFLEIGNPQGKPLVFIHGFNDSMDSFSMVARKLDSKKYRMILIDLPGFSVSEKTESKTYNVENYAKWVGELLGKLEIRCASIIGNSLGGVIAAKVAIDFSHLISSLVLVNTAGVVLDKDTSFYQRYSRGDNPFNLATMEDFMNFRDSVFKADIYIPHCINVLKFEEFKRDTNWLNKIMDDLMGDIPKPDKIKEWGLTPFLSLIKVPTLALWGDCDHMFPIETIEVLEREIADFKSQIFHGVGHCPQFEKPTELAQAIDIFVK